MFGNIGASEIILVLALTLIIFGPKKLPEIGRSFGKTLNEFRRASFSSFNDIESEIREAEFKEADARKKAESQKTEVIEEARPTVARAENSSEKME